MCTLAKTLVDKHKHILTMLIPGMRLHNCHGMIRCQIPLDVFREAVTNEMESYPLL